MSVIKTRGPHEPESLTCHFLHFLYSSLCQSLVPRALTT